MGFVDAYIANILSLQVSLYHARARLTAGSDSDALHDLRIATRKLRSLLRPLRDLPEVAPLNAAAAAVGRDTTPVRDLEVIIGELRQLEHEQQAASRASALPARYAEIASSTGLDTLFAELDRWPEAFRQAEAAGRLAGVEKQVSKALRKRISQLVRGLKDPAFDRHQLRIIVKNTRYLTEAFPELSPLGRKARAELKTVQGALGSWHDHHQWCVRAETEHDLRGLAPRWNIASQKALSDAEHHLASLLKALEKALEQA